MASLSQSALGITCGCGGGLGCGDPNSGLHACMASVLIMGHFLNCLIFFSFVQGGAIETGFLVSQSDLKLHT